MARSVQPGEFYGLHSIAVDSKVEPDRRFSRIRAKEFASARLSLWLRLDMKTKLVSATPC
jgi:hypothetical protein